MALGYADKGTAEILGLSAETVRGHVRSLMHALSAGTDLPPSRPLLATLFWLHAGCCTASLIRAVDTGTVFREQVRDG